jgi:hypothetical protein
MILVFCPSLKGKVSTVLAALHENVALRSEGSALYAANTLMYLEA